MAGKLDYYQILHVHPDAPLEIIKASYRTLMQRLKAHPDLGGDAHQAARINEAYETLRDAERRQAYDAACRTNRGMPNDNAPSKASARTCVFCTRDNAADAEDCAHCGAPLRSRHPTDVANGQRVLERMPKQQTALVRLSKDSSADVRATTRDISPHGMLLESEFLFEPSQLVSIDCDACRAVGRVAHVRREGRLCIAGIEFLTVAFGKIKGTFVSARA